MKKTLNSNEVATKVKKADRSRILIADDEKSVCDILQRILSLKLKETRVDAVVNGAEAVECFRDIHHGLIIMDIKMPKMNGIQAYKEIYEICTASNWEMPTIIFCTGFTPPETMEEIIAADSRNSLLLKPVENDELLETIRDALGKNREDV